MKSTPPLKERKPGTARRLLLWPPLWVLTVAFLVPPPGPDNQSLLGLPPLCPTKALLHFPCPGCGLSRSLVCCAHGELTRAFLLHPLGPLLFVVLVGVVVLRLFPRLRAPSQKLVNTGALVLIVLLLSLWAVRLLGWLPKPP